MKLLKVLNGLISPHKNMEYEIGKKYSCDICMDETVRCAPGFYAVDWDGLHYVYRPGLSVYEVEVDGRKVEYDPIKRRYEEITLLRELSLQEIKDGLKKASKKVGYDLYHISFPVNPLKGRPKKVTQGEIELLRKWVSIKDSIRSSIKDSIVDSVEYSIWGSVEDSVWDSVGDLIWSSIRSPYRAARTLVAVYISSLFPNITKWGYIDHKPGENPFQPGIDLWLAGFVPFSYGSTCMLLSGKKAEVVYQEK